MFPPAPARFSTRNCWPRASLSLAPTILAMMSTGPPGAKGTMTRTRLFRQPCAPQAPKSTDATMGRINPDHATLRTGPDACSGVLDKRGTRAADDMVVMPLQCGTQWDGLGHVFYENSMWNG